MQFNFRLKLLLKKKELTKEESVELLRYYFDVDRMTNDILTNHIELVKNQDHPTLLHHITICDWRLRH